MMTLHEKLADWLTGGEYSERLVQKRTWIDMYRKADDMALDHMFKSSAAHAALREIAEQETPTANATVKRMAKIARGAME